MTTTNTTQHAHKQHNAHDHVTPKDDFRITYPHYKNEKKTQPLKIKSDLAKKHFPKCPSTLARDGTEGKSAAWHEKLIFENECGRVWQVDYKHWKDTGYVLHGEGWNAYRHEVKLEAEDVLCFRKDQTQEKKYFVTIEKKPPTEQDGGRAAKSNPRITTGHHETCELVPGKEVPSTSAGQVQLEKYLGNAAGENSIPSLPCHENNFRTGAFPSTNLVVFPSAALVQDRSDNEENLDQDSGDKGKRPLENDEEEAPRNIRPNHGHLSGETRAGTNRPSLANTEVKEYLLSILALKTAVKAHEQKFQKLEALVEGAKTQQDAVESRISILEAIQNSSGVLPPEPEPSQANVPQVQIHGL